MKLFCDFVNEQYGNIFLNRRPSLKYLKTIEECFATEVFPGCIGFLETILLGDRYSNGQSTTGTG